MGVNGEATVSGLKQAFGQKNGLQIPVAMYQPHLRFITAQTRREKVRIIYGNGIPFSYNE